MLSVETSPHNEAQRDELDVGRCCRLSLCPVANGPQIGPRIPGRPSRACPALTSGLSAAQVLLPQRLTDFADDLASDEYGERWGFTDVETMTAVDRLRATAAHLSNSPRRGSAPSAVLFALKPPLELRYESACAALVSHLLSTD